MPDQLHAGRRRSRARRSTPRRVLACATMVCLGACGRLSYDPAQGVEAGDSGDLGSADAHFDAHAEDGGASDAAASSDGGPDGGSAQLDAGIDGGPLGLDAGTDGGPVGFDGGTDSGPVGFDGGTDGGPVGFDGGLDAGSDAGPAGLDAGTDAGGGSVCAPATDLGASGCLTGPGPIALWQLDRASAAPVPDGSGRAPCVPLVAMGAVVFAAGGADLSGGGTLGLAASDATALMTAIASAQRITIELWVHTTVSQSAPILAFADGTTTRIAVYQTSTGTQGVFEGSPLVSVNTPLDSGGTHDLFSRHDGTTYAYSDGLGGSIANPSSYAWDSSTASFLLGPWSGVIVSVSVYDRALSDAEKSCLATAGPSITP